jgi:hypothetical protein
LSPRRSSEVPTERAHTLCACSLTLEALVLQSCRASTLPILAASLTALVTGCLEDPDLAEPATAMLAAGACPVSGTIPERSLAVTDDAVLAKFAFGRVMDRLRATAGVTAVQSNLGIFQAWMKTFGSSAAAGDCNDANIDPNKYGLRCPRVAEAALASTNPFAATSLVTFQPVGLFNRFDLAPASGANCGEYRIVYSLSTSGVASVTGPGFLIFEATLPNPTPAAGVNACLPVARFWQDLSADTNVASRATKLEKFYFTGGVVAGFPAIVNAKHYGLANGASAAFGAGQVRTNMFVNTAEWQLREFKLRKACSIATDPSSCRLTFSHVPVKANPAEELFAGTHTKSASFLPAFLAQIPALIRPSAATIGLATADGFNEFESISMGGLETVRYAEKASVSVKAAIQQKLTALGSTLTPTNVLDRATTQTCAGCHEFSVGADLGGGVAWPPTNRFTHIDEGKQLSPALVTVFLPRRRAVLESFINTRCAPAAAAKASVIDTGLTLGGSPVGAAN